PLSARQGRADDRNDRRRAAPVRRNRCRDRPGRHRRLVPRALGVGTPGAGEPLDPRRSAALRHEGGPEPEDQTSRVLPAVRAVDPRRADRRMVHDRPSGSVHDQGLSDPAGEARLDPRGHPRRRHRPPADRLGTRESALLAADLGVRAADRRADRDQHLVQRKRADRQPSEGSSRLLSAHQDGPAGARRHRGRAPIPTMRALFEAWAKPHYLYRPVQLLRRIARGLARPGAREIVALPWGLDLIVDPREAIGSALWHLGVFDLALTETLWRLLEPGDLALDVGANIGYTTGLMALRVGSTGRVLAFEPHPAVHAQLVANAERARRNPRCGEIRTFETALGAVTGVARLAPGSYFADNNGIARLTDEPDV